ncbi:uncharacterized protein (DUF488 family) [Bacillus ectoiniformans]|uniref:hypothetical protein n=1 Tax=Bacillus ectoiniformans TaxID=1494429 RepID=UPI0019569B28|nr:hypothetical protein [Bacillus ectoiniformans]MBM7648381.1 uncharacterized protein (DUF488 family) [Bacillus ectoiniformans]
MLSNLSQGVKISITRSITTSFTQYMNSISWSEKAFNLEDFVSGWRNYINESASWYSQISDEMKADPVFHQELAGKINEVIDKILTEPASQEQLDQLNTLQKELGTSYEISCKAEAKFFIDYLTEELKKKQSR